MNVSFYDFKKQHSKELQREILSRFETILENNSYVEGNYNDSFEKSFATAQGAKHCLLVANGTDALEIALQAYGIKPGDLVAVPGITFFASAECVINRGAIPVHVDVDPATGLICLESFKRMTEEFDIKAVIPVHIYGQPAPIKQLETLCGPKDIKIIEDSAQAQGGFYPSEKPIGSSNNLCTFSFYPTKNLSAYGDAGAILTHDEKLAEIIKSIRNHGRCPDGHGLIGRNSRCDHMQAAVLDAKVSYIEQWNQQRKELATLYYEFLKDADVTLLPKEMLQLSSWHQFPIMFKSREQRDKVKDYLASKEIASGIYYAKALGEEPTLNAYKGETEKAIHFAATTLCMPIHPFLEKKEIELVSTCLSEALG